MTTNIVVIKPNKIGQTQWDQFNYSSLSPNLYCCWHHLEAVTSGWGRQGWEIWAGPTEETTSWQWVMPVPLKYGGWVKGVVQPLFTQQLGVLFAQSCSLAQQVEVLTQVLNKLEAKAIYAFNHQNWELLNRAGIISESRNAVYSGEFAPNYCLNLNDGYDSIEKAYQKNLGRKLKKGQSPAIQYHVNSHWEIVVDLFNQYINLNNSILNQRQQKKLSKVCKAWANNKQLITTLAYNADGALLAGLLYMCFPDGYRGEKRYIAFMGGATALGKTDGTQMKLMDHNIKTFAENGGGIYDFEGSRIESIQQVFKTFSPELLTYFVVN